MEYSQLFVFVLIIPTFLQILLPPAIITALFLMLPKDRLLRIFLLLPCQEVSDLCPEQGTQQ